MEGSKPGSVAIILRLLQQQKHVLICHEDVLHYLVRDQTFNVFSNETLLSLLGRHCGSECGYQQMTLVVNISLKG